MRQPYLGTGMVVHPVLRVGTVVPSTQSLFESLKSFGVELVVLSSRPSIALIMNLMMILNYEMNYNVVHFNYVTHY